MDGFPLNLILAVATASATIFLGFLPTKSISSPFFAKQAGLAIFAWALVAFTSHAQFIHYLLMLAFLCFAAWWSFRRDRALGGKMWLSVASGLGISVGVMLILDVTPGSLPANPSFATTDALADPHIQMGNKIDQAALLASIYVGGAVIGMAYIVDALSRSGYLLADRTHVLIQRYASVLTALTVVRGVLLLITYYVDFNGPVIWVPGQRPSYVPANISAEDIRNFDCLAALGLGVIVIPLLAFLAQRALRSSEKRANSLLVAICLLGFLVETLARWEML